MPVHAVLAVVDEIPVLRAIVERLIPLPDDVRRWIFVVCAQDQGEPVDAALGDLSVVHPFEEKETAPRLEARTVGDLRALLRAIGVILEAPANGPFLTGSSYLNLGARAVATTDRALVRARLLAAGLTVADAASLTADRPPIDDEAAIARAMVPFEEHFSPEVAKAVRAYLEGPEGPVPEIVREAKSEYDGDTPAAMIRDALTGAVERWNPRTSGKLLDLWIALRKPLETDMHLGLGEDALLPELGIDRARLLAETLEARGLPPVLALVAARGYQGASTWFLAPSLLGRPEIFVQALSLDRSIARKLAAQAVPCMGLEDAPTVQEHLRAFLASHSEALGTEALSGLADKHLDDIDEEHIENAAIGADPVEVCKLAAKVEKAAGKRLAGALRRAHERWIAAADPVSFIATLARMLDREKEVVDANVAWLRLVDLISQNPGEPFGGPESRAYWNYLSILAQLQKPTGEAKERLVALCKEKGNELGLRKSLEKKAGIKPPPSPHAAADLAGLPDAWAKAWKTARERSWEAGYRLPAGANEETLAAAEKALGMPLPGDVRSFYALHDGAGEDECFRGCRLYGIEEAVEKRKWLLSIEGAPFDSTWLPVTDDGAGNHACVVLEGKNAGSVMDFDHETGCGRRLAKSFAAYVQGSSWE